MTIHKEGYPSIAITILFAIALNTITHYFLNEPVFTISGYIISGFLFIIILQFFRSPKRNIVTNEEHIISPADGKVVVIEEVTESEYFNEARLQISVFMSPLNVHLNRYPIGGTVKYYKYHPGSYLVAWHPKSSTENERTTTVVEDGNHRTVLFRQIAGALARRIVSYSKENTQVIQGNECGFIKFGSRVDLLLPVDVKVNVKLGDVVKGGESIIAKFNK